MVLDIVCGDSRDFSKRHLSRTREQAVSIFIHHWLHTSVLRARYTKRCVRKFVLKWIDVLHGWMDVAPLEAAYGLPVPSPKSTPVSSSSACLPASCRIGTSLRLRQGEEVASSPHSTIIQCLHSHRSRTIADAISKTHYELGDFLAAPELLSPTKSAEETPVLNALQRFSMKLQLIMQMYIIYGEGECYSMRIKKVVCICDKLRRAGNYDGVAAILRALNADALGLLTWERIPRKWRMRKADMEILLSPARGHYRYRMMVRAAADPLFPDLELLLRDLDRFRDFHTEVVVGCTSPSSSNMGIDHGEREERENTSESASSGTASSGAGSSGTGSRLGSGPGTVASSTNSTPLLLSPVQRRKDGKKSRNIYSFRCIVDHGRKVQGFLSRLPSRGHLEHVTVPVDLQACLLGDHYFPSEGDMYDAAKVMVEQEWRRRKEGSGDSLMDSQPWEGGDVDRRQTFFEERNSSGKGSKSARSRQKDTKRDNDSRYKLRRSRSVEKKDGVLVPSRSPRYRTRADPAVNWDSFDKDKGGTPDDGAGSPPVSPSYKQYSDVRREWGYTDAPKEDDVRHELRKILNAGKTLKRTMFSSAAVPASRSPPQIPQTRASRTPSFALGSPPLSPSSPSSRVSALSPSLELGETVMSVKGKKTSSLSSLSAGLESEIETRSPVVSPVPHGRKKWRNMMSISSRRAISPDTVSQRAETPPSREGRGESPAGDGGRRKLRSSHEVLHVLREPSPTGRDPSSPPQELAGSKLSSSDAHSTSPVEATTSVPDVSLGFDAVSRHSSRTTSYETTPLSHRTDSLTPTVSREEASVIDALPRQDDVPTMFRSPKGNVSSPEFQRRPSAKNVDAGLFTSEEHMKREKEKEEKRESKRFSTMWRRASAYSLSNFATGSSVTHHHSEDLTSVPSRSSNSNAFSSVTSVIGRSIGKTHSGVGLSFRSLVANSLVFDGDGSLIGGEWGELVDFLLTTVPPVSDVDLRRFLLGYTSVASLQEFASALSTSFHLLERDVRDGDIENRYLNSRQNMFLRFLTMWVETVLSRRSAPVPEEAASVIAYISTTLQKWGLKNRLLELLQKASPPLPIKKGPVDKAQGAVMLEALRKASPLTVADCITAMQKPFLRNISPNELCLYCVQNEVTEALPSLVGLRNVTQRISNIVASDIVQSPPSAMKRYVKIANALFKSNDLNGVAAVLDGLTNPAVARLVNYWMKLPTKYVQMYGSLRELYSEANDYAAYKAYRQQCSRPMVLYLRVELRELVALRQSFPDTISVETEWDQQSAVLKPVYGSLSSSSALDMRDGSSEAIDEVGRTKKRASGSLSIHPSSSSETPPRALSHMEGSTAAGDMLFGEIAQIQKKQSEPLPGRSTRIEDRGKVSGHEEEEKEEVKHVSRRNYQKVMSVGLRMEEVKYP